MKTWALAAATMLWFAGCVASTSETTAGPAGLESGAGAFIVGIVLDLEIVPVEGAAITASPGEHRTVTNDNGLFRVGPFDPGTTVAIHAEKTGYAPGDAETVAVEGSSERLVITLRSVATSVPYHETIPHVAFIDCAWAISGLGSLPCNPVDRQLGTNYTNDQSQWFFKIPSPSVAGLLHEAVWQPNALGKDMRFLLFHPDLVSGSAVGGDVYLDSRGGSPDRSWLYPGKEAERADVPFNGTEGFDYQALYRPWTTNSTVSGVAIYVQHRVENYYTFFYHRAGSEQFTVLPDA